MKYNLLVSALLSFVCTSFAWTSTADAGCRIAVGGPNVIATALEKLTTAVDKKLSARRDYDLTTFSIDHFSQLVTRDADFLVYLKGNRSEIEVEFRDVVVNYAIFERVYSASDRSFDATIDQIVADIETFGIPKLPEYCK